MSHLEGLDLSGPGLPRIMEAPPLRAVDSPQPAGNASDAPASPAPEESKRYTTVADPAASPERAPAGPPAEDQSFGQHPHLQWAMNGLRMALPFVQKVLPLLDGQVLPAVINLLAHRPEAPAAPVNLAPLEGGLADLQNRHRELSQQVEEQIAALNRVEDRLETVREAINRNWLEQQELLEDLKKSGRKSTVWAVVAATFLT
ncbi:MAG: hypothetical protein WBX18_07080, partial [Terracidiphilus sp.]